MRRMLLVGLLLACFAGGIGLHPAYSQDGPLYLNRYFLVPRLSELERSGGFAGVHDVYRLIGRYDLVRGYAGPTDVYRGDAYFQDAEIWGSIISDRPHTLEVLDVDQLLNLESLVGEILPVAAPFDVYKFTGKIADGSSIELFASVFGPWMYLRGGTMPPPGSADYFQYQLHAVARTRPWADANGDGVVDAADYTLLRDAAGSGAGAVDGLAAGVNLADWKEQFGERVPDFTMFDGMFDGAGSALAATSSAPEPATTVLLAVGALTIVAWRRHKVAG